MKRLENANIHFIGVGGTSMSALARYAAAEGASVTGSDRVDGIFLQELKRDGFDVYSGSNTSYVDRADVVVFSSAVPEGDVELSRARELKKKVFERYEFLGEISENFDKVVAVGGTHGKTTVTAMLAHIFKLLDVNFVGHVGGETEFGNLVVGNNKINELNNFYGGHVEENEYGKSYLGTRTEFGNLVVGNADGKRESVFLTEACEYRRSLLALKPYIGVVLNAECDHPDCYPDIDSVYAVFNQFLDNSQIKITPIDFSICHNAHISKCECGSTENPSEKATKQRSAAVSSNGKTEIWTYVEAGIKSGIICVMRDGRCMGAVKLPVDGDYNKRNALFALAAASSLGLDFGQAARALTSFKGVKRRFEKVGKLDGAEVIFDYAHHPTQLASVLGVAKEKGRVLTVFQPHTYSRTAEYMDDFASVLSKCDSLILMPTYAAREKTERGATSEELYLRILSDFPETDVYLASSVETTLESVISHAKDYDLILFLGAGDIYNLKDRLDLTDKP